MHRLRREGKTRVNDAQYSRSTNPKRADKRRRQRARDRYEYEKAQYEYYNQRRKVARRVLQSSSDKADKCQIPIEQLEAHYRSIDRPSKCADAGRVLKAHSAARHRSVRVKRCQPETDQVREQTTRIPSMSFILIVMAPGT